MVSLMMINAVVVVAARNLEACLDAAATVPDLELLRRGFEPLVRRFRRSLITVHRFRLNHRVGS